MTDLLRTILLRVTVAGVASAAALAAAGSGVLREAVRLAAGLLMLLALLQPLAGFHLPTQQTGAAAVPAAELEQQNTQAAMSAIGSSIARSLGKRAAELGTECTFSVDMGLDADGILQISRVVLCCPAKDSDAKTQLMQMVEEECGVTADRLEWMQR